MKAIAAVQSYAIACSIRLLQSELIIMLTHLGFSPNFSMDVHFGVNCAPDDFQHLPSVGNNHADTRP
ncbi:hypothetical protein [Dendronalium sp. ChiSLP03b]|uniref:hypothetical protein n=1 Tax=Dendronalium sp. ChiSLP03b TaxID=3075381 RepID=UPI00391CB03F